MAATYTAKDILVLEGLEPVRRRPGMYIGGVDKTGLHHLLWEIVDNAVDEAMNRHCDRITVVLHKDGASATVADNGRGIPVDRHAQYKKPALELILTTLHAGGKFEAKNYYHSGGLHGVGASVVTALSEKLVASVKRDGAQWEQSFARGKAASALKKTGPARGTGTTIFFRPDPQIFPDTRFDPKLVAEVLEAKAYLHGGLTLEFVDERAGTKATYHYEDGLRAFLARIVGDAKEAPLAGEVLTVEKEQDGLHLECALAWTEATEERVLSYVNSIPTTAGGAHENGLKAGVVKAVRNYVTVHNLLPRGLAITAEDVREGVVALLAIKIPNPQFQGQTKERLNNAEVTPAIDGIVRTALENALNANRTWGDAVANRVVLAARARSASRAAAQQVQRKGAVSHRLNLPGKLADCTSTDPAECELFIVEGDSAGGSAKQGRERSFQAILPLRGKVLNTEQASTAKVLTNKELADLVSALGCGTGKDFDLAKLRYHKVCLLMDADSDGNHICTLLLTFFYRHLPQLIRSGHVYIAQPPLYRIDAGKQTLWARDDVEKERLLGQMNGKRERVQVTRFKGLGEMNPSTLKETTLDPARRALLRVRIQDEPATEATIQTLMGREVAPRFELIMERARRVARSRPHRPSGCRGRDMSDLLDLADAHAAARKVVWAYLATAVGDQPKVRVVHPLWEGDVVWIATGRRSAKARQLERNPKVELFYQIDPSAFVHLTVTGRGRFVDDPAEKRRVWGLFDYDLGQFWRDASDADYGLLRIDAERVELTSLPGMMSGAPPRVWRRG